MQKKVTFFTQNYDPKWEAISKEVEILHNNFPSRIFDINTSNPLSLTKAAKIPFVKSEIYHIYTSLGDRLFLPFVRGRPLVITGSASAPKEKISRQIKHYRKVDKIIVESERQRGVLLELGVDEGKIEVIYPGIDLNKFAEKKPEKHEKFTVLFASSPPTAGQIESRGVNLILDCAKELPNVRFVLAWRNVGYSHVMKKIQLHGLKNVEVINEFIDGTEILYAQSDCTIAPFFHYDTEKPVPRSIIESLACGRPVLVTDRVNIFDLIKQENCGIVFEPDAGSLIGAIGRLSKNYEAYRKNCRIVAERHFSKDMFIKRYSKVYEELK